MKLVLMWAFPVLLSAQPWSTFLDPSRVVDWRSSVGFTIPNYSVNCATQPSLTANDPSAAPANTTSVQNALASCDATHNVVNIPAGTYYVAGWTYGAQGYQVVRGAGPMSTTVHLTGEVGCGGLFQGICMISNPVGYNGSPAVLPPSGANQCLWTAGYAQGTTTITLSSCGGAPPLNQTLILDQANDPSDTGGVYICDSRTAGCTYEGPGNYNGRIIGGVTYSQKQIVYTTGVTSLGGGSYSVAISPGVYFTNIRSGQGPGAWWPGFVQSDGLENMTVYHDFLYLNVASATGFVAGNYVKGVTSGVTAYIISVDTTNNNIYLTGQQGGAFQTSEVIQQTATRGGPPTGVQSTNNTGYNQYPQPTSITMFSCYQCWVRNIVSILAPSSHVGLLQSLNDVIRDSYFYQSPTHGSESYGIGITSSSDTLVENNIFQQLTNPIMFGQGSGCVIGYNYSTDSLFGGVYLSPAYYSHGPGNTMNLFEGNNFNGIAADDAWGSSGQGTLFRNMLTGWQTGNTASTEPLFLRSYNRIFNVTGNVLGQPSYHNQYQSYATSPSGGSGAGNDNTSIYSLGWGGSATCGTGGLMDPACDPLVFSTLARWGNYDTFNTAVRWDSTEASPAAVTYVNANFTSSYFGSLAHTLPASLYYNSKPSWWPTAKAWPATGPDITTGNIGTCIGGTYVGAMATSASQCTGGTLASPASTTQAWASHTVSIPAQDCYLTTMGGPPDGTGNLLSFDANTCYYGAVGTVATPTDSPGMGTYTGPQTITLTDATSGAAICYTVNGTTPTATTAGTCDSLTGEMTYSVPFTSPGSTFTLKAIGTKAGLVNSGLLTSVYTISAGPPPTTGYSGTLSGTFH